MLNMLEITKIAHTHITSFVDEVEAKSGTELKTALIALADLTVSAIECVPTLAPVEQIKPGNQE